MVLYIEALSGAVNRGVVYRGIVHRVVEWRST